jgi:hypothetical protein
LRKRAANAKHHDTYYTATLKQLEAHMPARQDAITQLMLDNNAIGLTTALPIPGYQAVMRHCEKPITDAQPIRRSDCRALATLMEQSNTLISVHIGLALKERVANSAAKLAGVKEQRDALRAYVQDLAAHGEMGLIRRAAQAKGLTTGQLAQQYRARQKTHLINSTMDSIHALSQAFLAEKAHEYCA